MAKYYDEDGRPQFKSLGRFRIIWLDQYREWYCSKFIYYPSGSHDIIYEGFQEFEYAGEVVMTLVDGNKPAVTLIPKRFLEEVKG